MSLRLKQLVPLLPLAFGACYSQAPAPEIRRAHPDEQIDLSGTWNDRDANEVAAVMIRDCLGHPWLEEYTTEAKKRPVLRLYPIRNRSSEHIETRFYTKQVEQELINSRHIRLVADLEEAQDNRLERADQNHYASDETLKHHQQETGSDFVMNGWIVTEHDAAGGREVRAYAITMELSNSETNEKVWVKTHRIKKDIQRHASTW